MGFRYRIYLEGRSSVYGCSICRTHLSTSNLIISKHFNGQHGEAFLFDKVVNVQYGDPESRLMSSGPHKVRDIFCIKCSQLLGWNYVKAYSNSNQYKEGKFVLETKLFTVVSP
ncbi:Yippee/Mis18 [Pilobolus umbonatus]|nr:Yippee/Mis18 [Pilobolus umbonatus]